MMVSTVTTATTIFATVDLLFWLTKTMCVTRRPVSPDNYACSHTHTHTH